MPKGLLQAYAIKKPAFVFGIEDLMAVKDSPTMRLTATPFVHNYEDTVFLGHAAPWKGIKGAKGAGVPKELKARFPGVADGLSKIIDISQACRGVKGVVRWGDHWLPKKVICQIERAKGRAAPA